MPLVGLLYGLSHSEVTQYPAGSALTVPKLQQQIEKDCPKAPSLANVHVRCSALSAQFKGKLLPVPNLAPDHGHCSL